MLRELHISNLAVISDVRIELAPGLNGFTGATGAGKSLVLGALELLLGLRSGTDMLRPGADEGRVSGLFELRDPALLKIIGQATDMPVADDGGELLITRRLHASGRSSVSLNGRPITLGMLKTAAEHLVDVHGQHDHQFLLRPSNQLQLLDQFAGIESQRQQYQEQFEQLQSMRQRLETLTAGRALRDQQLELHRFQAQEIDAAELSAGEFEELSARASVLGNLERLKRETSATHAALYEIDGSVLERLKGMASILGELAGLDQALDPISRNLRDATISLEETAFDLSRYLGRLEIEPGELEEVNDRLNTLNRLVAKYGDTVEDVLTYRHELEGKIAELQSAGDNLSELQSRMDPLRVSLGKLGRSLSTARRAAAAKLTPRIESALGELGMDKAKFTIEFTPADDPTPTGLDTIEFIAQTNPGQLPQPLRRIASGGELSRIMLALKGILAGGGRVSVLVFDEIDANVGGRLGGVIGRKLRSLADHHQVLCITHLPQIACYADRHLTVHKQVVGDQTQTTVRVVQGEERIEELAEMIGGRHITEVTRAQARELLETALGNSAKPPPAKPKRRGKAS